MKKIEILDQEDYIIPVKKTEVKKKQRILKKLSQNCKKLNFLVRVCKNNCLNGYSQGK